MKLAVIVLLCLCAAACAILTPELAARGITPLHVAMFGSADDARAALDAGHSPLQVTRCGSNVLALSIAADNVPPLEVIIELVPVNRWLLDPVDEACLNDDAAAIRQHLAEASAPVNNET